MQGGSATSPYAVPVIEWQGNCSEIQHSNDGEMFLGNASSGKQVNHIFWGDPGLASSYESDMRVGPVCNSTTAKNKNAIEPGYKSSDKATPSSYVWFPVTFYKNQEDAVNEMNAIGTAYISASTLQTNSTTVEYSKLKDSRTTYGDVVNMTLKRDGDTTESGNSYFLNYNDGTHKTLTDYPAFEGDADKWIILGGADLSAKIAQGFSCYSVKANPNDLSQGYVTGLKSSYSATGKDIEPSVTVYNSNNEVVSAENYTISYQRKEGSNWVDASGEGAHGTYGDIYRMVIKAKGSTYTGSLITSSYTIVGHDVGTIVTAPISHTNLDGTIDTIDCKFKVLTASTGGDSIGAVAVGTCTSFTDTSTEEEIKSGLAIDNTITGSIEIPSSINVGGIKYNVTKVGTYAFGYSKTEYSCKISGCKLPKTITAIGYGAFSACVNLASLNIPANTTTIDGLVVNIDETVDTVLNLCFEGDAPAYGEKVGFTFTRYSKTNLLFNYSSQFGSVENPRSTPYTKFYGGGEKWYKVDFCDSNKKDAAVLSSIYVKESTTAAEILDGTAEAINQDGTEAKLPTLPSGKTSWTISDTSEYGMLDKVTCGSKLSFYANDAAATDISTMHIVGATKKLWCDGTDLTPDFTLVSAKGETVSIYKYDVSYEIKDGDSWKSCESYSKEGTYRATITSKSSSELTGELKFEYEIARPDAGEEIIYPVENILPNGTTQKINMVFKVYTAAQGDDTGELVVLNSQKTNGTTASEAERAISIDTQGKVVIPDSIKLGDGTYNVTMIGRNAFKAIKGLTGITLPNNLKTIAEGAFDSTSLKQVIIPANVSYIGKNAFCKTIDLKSNNEGTIKEVIFKGTANINSNISSATLDMRSIFKNVNTTSGAFLFENETNSRTINVSDDSTLQSSIYYKVNYFESQSSYEAGEDCLRSVFVKKGATPEKISSNLYFGDYCKKTVPSLPSGSAAGTWEYSTIADIAISNTDTIGTCLNAFAPTAENSLASYKFKTMVKGVTYPWTGSAIEPDFGSIVSRDGAILDKSNYTVTYQRKNDLGQWEDTTDIISEGTLRIRILPTSSSGFAGQLCSGAYKIEKAADPEVTRFSYPVKYVDENGNASLVDCSFLVIEGTNEVKTSGASTATYNNSVGKPGMTVPSYAGDLYIPEKISLNGKDYAVTCIGSYSFYISSSSVQTSVHIPSTVTKFEKYIYSKINYSGQTYSFSRFYYDDDCNISEMYNLTFNFDSAGYRTINEVIFKGKVSDYMKSNTSQSKGHLKSYGTAYGQVKYYANKEAYEANKEPVATVGIPLGTKISDLVTAKTSITAAKSLDAIPSFEGSNNYWEFVGIESLSNTVQDGTLSCYACEKSEKDLSLAVVSTDQSEYIATGNEIKINVTATNALTKSEISSSDYDISYERLENGKWVASTDLIKQGTLRVKITPTAASSYEGMGYSQRFTIKSLSNEKWELFQFPTDYMEKDGIWGNGMVPDRQVPCTYQIIKPATEGDYGYIQLASSTGNSSESSSPCVDSSLTGTLILPETINTDTGIYKLICVSMSTTSSDSNYGQYPLNSSKLTGLVIPNTVNSEETKEALGAYSVYFQFPNYTKLKRVYFEGDFSNEQVQTYGYNSTFYIFNGKAATVSKQWNTGYAGSYVKTYFYPSKKDAIAKTNLITYSLILSDKKISEINTEFNSKTDTVELRSGTVTRNYRWQTSPEVPEFPSGTSRWMTLGNSMPDALVADDSSGNVTVHERIVYAISASNTDLSQSYFYNPGQKKEEGKTDSEIIYTQFTDLKTYDGEALATKFALRDFDGNVIPEDAYTVSYERMNNNGAWEECSADDFVEIGKYRINVKAVDGKGYTGENSIECTIEVPNNFSVPMAYTYVPAGSSKDVSINVDVNLLVRDIDEATNTITASIASNGSNKAVSISSDYAGGTLKLIDSTTKGMYKINIESIDANAFGDNNAEKAVEAVQNVIIPAGIKTIKGNAFTKTLCDVTFENGCKASVEADAFKEAGVQAVIYNCNASDIKLDKNAFNGINGDDGKIKVLFNAGADKSKNYGNLEVIYSREEALEELISANEEAKSLIDTFANLASAEKDAAKKSLDVVYSTAEKAINAAKTIEDIEVTAADAKEKIASVAEKTKEAEAAAKKKKEEEAAKKAAAAKELARRSATGYSEVAGKAAAKATYKITSATKLTVEYVATASKAKSVTVPATVKLSNGKTYKVTSIGAKAFGKKAKTVTIKTKNLTKKTVKKALKSSKVKTVKVKVGKKADNKKFVKKYKKIFTKKIAGKKVIVK